MSNACFLSEAHFTVGMAYAWFGLKSLFLNYWSSCRLMAVSLSKPAPAPVSPAFTHGLRRWRLLAGQERGYKIACLRWALFTTYNRPVTEETESLHP